jgi:hypothetical protein
MDNAVISQKLVKFDDRPKILSDNVKKANAVDREKNSKVRAGAFERRLQ